MPYRNQYNEMIANDIDTLNRKYIEHMKMTGQNSGDSEGMEGGILGALGSMVFPMVMSNVAKKLFGGAGFAQGTFMDTGFDPTLGAVGDGMSGAGLSAGVREYKKGGIQGCGDCGCGYGDCEGCGLSGGAEFMEAELEEAKKMLDDEVKRCKDEQDDFHRTVIKKLEEIENIRQKINEIKTIDMKEKRDVCRTTQRDKRRNIRNIEKSQSKHARDLEKQQNKFAKEQMEKQNKEIAKTSRDLEKQRKKQAKEQDKQLKKTQDQLVKAIEKQAKADQPKQPKTPKPKQPKTSKPKGFDIVEIDDVERLSRKEKGKEVIYEIVIDKKGNQKKGKKIGTLLETGELEPIQGSGLSGGRQLIPVANMPGSMMSGGGIEDLKRYQAKLKQVRLENPSLSLKEARQMLKDGAFDRQIKQRRKYTKKVEGKKELPDALKMFNAKVKQLRLENPGLSLKDARQQVKEMKGSGFFDDFADGFMSVIRPVAKVAKMLPTPLSPVLSAIGLGKSGGMYGEGVEDLKKYQALVKEAQLRGMSLKQARDYVKQGNFFGKQKRTYTKKADGVNKRAEIVKKVMKDRGVSMIQASKIVKAEGLYP